MRPARRAAGFAVAVPVALLLAAGPAAAQVGVVADPATAGATDATLVFLVRNDDPAVATVRVEVFLPVDSPLAVRPSAPEGWTAQVTTTHLAAPVQGPSGPRSDVATSVVWAGGELDGDARAEFALQVERLPDRPGPLSFPVRQTYIDGNVVYWVERPRPDQDAPERPAPTVELTPPGTSTAGGTDAGWWPVALTVGLAALLLRTRRRREVAR